MDCLKERKKQNGFVVWHERKIEPLPSVLLGMYFDFVLLSSSLTLIDLITLRSRSQRNKTS